MELMNRPGRVLKQISALNAEAEHLKHHRAYLEVERIGSADREWNRPPITVTLAGPWKNREQGQILKAWGIPLTHGDLETFVHFRDGGWGVFELPRTPIIYAYLAKAQKHPDAVAYFELLCRITLHSQYTLAESINLLLDAFDADPMKRQAPAIRAGGWEHLGKYVIDVLQARMQNGGRPESVGDSARVGAGINQLSTRLDDLRLDAAEQRLASVRASLALRRAL